MVKQVVTLQLGHRANYVGTHFWNLQEQHLNSSDCQSELDPSAFFQESNTRSSSYTSSFLPRLQIVDASGAFGALSTDTASVKAFPTAESAHRDTCNAWSGYSQVFFRDQIPPHELSLGSNDTSKGGNCHAVGDDSGDSSTSPVTTKGAVRKQSVSYWSDFLSSPLHPQSCHPLTGVHHGVTDLSHFITGTDIATTTVLDDLCDNARTFVEQCDNFGGLLMLTNADDAFAGMTSSYLNTLVDEFGTSTPVLLFSAHRPDRLCTAAAAAKLKSSFRTAVEARMAQNEARLLSACISHNVQYVPVSPAAAMLLPTCQKRERMSMTVYSSLSEYQTTALPALGMHVSLTPLLTALGLPGLLASVRTTNVATYSCLFSNISQIVPSLWKNQDFVSWDGTVNMSGMWTFADNVTSQTDDRYKMRMNSLVHRDQCITTFGFSGLSGERETYPLNSPQRRIKIRKCVDLPIQFPPVLDLPTLGRTEEKGMDINRKGCNTQFQDISSKPDEDGVKMSRNSVVTVAAGLVDDRATAATALRGLSSFLELKWSGAGNKVFDKVTLEALQEDLISRAADLDEDA